MQRIDNRASPITSTSLSEIFRRAGGYLPMGNQELAGSLLRWKLLDPSNRANPEISVRFLRWSLTASFLQLLNSMQWLMSGIVLQRSLTFPAQTLQQYYYSIFFSCRSFLAAHGKGHYTLDITDDASGQMHNIRRELWFNQGPPPSLQIKEKGSGGEHEVTADWFYEVFGRWDQRDRHPSVRLFEEDRKFHTSFRNMFTYSLADMAEELHHDAEESPIPDEVLLRLWERDPKLIDYFPEVFWDLTHIQVPLGAHCRLLDDFGEANPYTYAQEYSLRSLMSRHERTGLANLLNTFLRPLLARLGD